MDGRRGCDAFNSHSDGVFHTRGGDDDGRGPIAFGKQLARRIDGDDLRIRRAKLCLMGQVGRAFWLAGSGDEKLYTVVIAVEGGRRRRDHIIGPGRRTEAAEKKQRSADRKKEWPVLVVLH